MVLQNLVVLSFFFCLFCWVSFFFFNSLIRACSKCIWSNSAKEFHTNVNYYLSYCYFYYFCLLIYLDFQRVFYMCARACVHIYITINTQLKMVYKRAGIFLSQNDTTDWLYIVWVLLIIHLHAEIPSEIFLNFCQWLVNCKYFYFFLGYWLASSNKRRR